MKHIPITTIAAVVVLLFGGVNEVYADPLTYEVSGDTVSIIDCKTSATGDLVIPSTYEGKPVTSIGEDAFNGCSSLTSVTIPNSVTSIGGNAFSSCSSLTRVKIPKSVTSIRDNVFYGCISLTNVTIPDSVKSIGEDAFAGCNSLTNVTIPDSVTSIGDRAFRYCRGLTSVTIPNSVTFIPEGAFFYCISLANVTIPDSVTRIGREAFDYCSSLTNVTIPDSVTRIGWEAFRGCSSLASVTIPDSVTNIGGGAFRGCSSLTSVTIPDSVTSMGEYLFYSCISLTSVTLVWDAPKFHQISKFVFRGMSGDAKILIYPGSTGFGETYRELPVFPKTIIYFDGEYSKGNDVKKTESANVSLSTHFPQGEIFYTLDGSKPSFTSTPYTAPFQLTESATIRAIAYSADFTNSIEAEPVSLRFLPNYSMNVSTGGGGTVSINPPAGPYLEGAEVTLTAIPEGKWDFIGWSGDSTSSDATITITMDEAKALTPTFGTNVTVNEIGEGQVIQTPPNPVPLGQTVKLEAIPNSRFDFFRWAGDISGKNPLAELIIRKPNPVASALFALSDDPWISVINDNGTLWPFTLSINTKQNITYVFQASGDLKSWSKVEEVNGTGGEVEFTDLREAIFQKQYYRVKLVE